MRKLSAFENISLDGYFTDAGNDMSWAHAGNDDAEYQSFVSGNAQGGGILVFGRVTYDMMASYWPSPLAKERSPIVAQEMNARTKYVASRTLKKADWANTAVLDDLVPAMRKLKNEDGPDMVILGSGAIVAQLAEAGLLDGLQVVVNPIALGRGRTVFDGVSRRLNFTLGTSRTFKNGKVVLSYTPAG
jgi:dihydrofolate reductase